MRFYRQNNALSLIVAAIVSVSSTAISAQEGEDAAPASPGAIPAPQVDTLVDMDRARANLDNLGALEAFVDGVVQATMQDKHIAGATVSIVRDGAIVLSKGYGYADVENQLPVDPASTMFRIGSVSKTFMWFALHQLADQGKLRLDDPVNDHLPDNLQVPDQGFAEPIRIRDLMWHAPGFEDTALGHLFAFDKTERPPRNEYAAIYRPNRVRPAADTSSYSNYGALLGGIIIEQVSGQEFEAYIEENIYVPLGMEMSTFREPGDLEGYPAPISDVHMENMSRGYEYKQGGYEEKDFEIITQIAPAGSMSSTATDMANYMIMLLGRGQFGEARLISEAGFQRIHDTRFTSLPGVNGLRGGFMEYNFQGGATGYGHGGDTIYFHSRMALLPDHGVGIFVSTNSTTGAALRGILLDRLGERYFATEPGDAPSPADDFKERGQIYVGNYRINRRSYSSLEALFTLPSVLSVSINEDGYLVTSGGSRYIEIGEHLFRKDGGEDIIGFRLDEDGQANLLVHNSGILSFERIGFFSSPAWFGLVMGLTLLATIGVLTGQWLRRGRDIGQSALEARASQAMWFLGSIWLVFVIALTLAIIALTQANAAELMSFPATGMKFAMLAGVLAAIATLVGFATLYAVWKEGNWPIWRRIRHTAAILIYGAMILTLNAWHAIGFNYY